MIKIYNRSMQLIAYAEQAFSVSYEMPFNSLWTASFSLPANDEKNAECQAFNFVELYDDVEYIGLFRILPSSTKRSSDGATITYNCEHVLATLLDDVLFQYHTVGNAGYPTGNVMQYLLSKQSTQRWQLGTCDFDYQFEYTWENDNLLAALFSIPKPFIDEYMFSWDTTSYPWTLNLIRPAEGIEAYIRYGINLQGVERYEDPTDLCTRLYCLGYGEGVNQLTISEVNGGMPYLDSDTQTQYGIVCKTWVDRSIESADMLKARGQALLDQLKMPRLTYRVDAAELYAITQDPIDKFRVGAQVRVIDEELGIDFVSRVVKYTKGDVWGNPGAVNLEIANKTQDIASAMADLSQRQKINETHAQGATNIDSHDFADNCDSRHPAKLRFWVPYEAIRINKVLLSYRVEPFRAYSQAIEGGGAYVGSVTSAAGGSDIVTSGDGGIDVTYGYRDTGSAGEPSHSHSYRLVTGHKHNISLPSHTHKVNIEIPDHVHAIQYGIYEGPKATAIGLLVDDNVIPGSAISADSLDILPYLKTDEEGKIIRGQYHEIELVPNRLSRVECSVVIQHFIQSRGGTNA